MKFKVNKFKINRKSLSEEGDNPYLLVVPKVVKGKSGNNQSPGFLNKRQRIVIASVIVTIGLLFAITGNVFFLRYRYIIGLGIFTYIVSLWALWDTMTWFKAVILMILPVFFMVSVASFYYLFPVRWLTRLPFVVIAGLSFYVLMLSQNVFNVAAIRTIPLYRAASTVSFLFTLITAFFFFNVILAFKLPFYGNALAVGLISFPLVLQILWTIEMDKLNSSLIVASIILSLLVGEMALALSFWPVAPTIWSLFLSTSLYVILGVVTENFREKLGRRVVFEYLGVGVVVLIFGVLVTVWGG